MYREGSALKELMFYRRSLVTRLVLAHLGPLLTVSCSHSTRVPQSVLTSHTLALSCNFLVCHLNSQDPLPAHTQVVFIHLHYCHILLLSLCFSCSLKIQSSFFFSLYFLTCQAIFFHACKVLLQAGSLPKIGKLSDE